MPDPDSSGASSEGSPRREHRRRFPWRPLVVVGIIVCTLLAIASQHGGTRLRNLQANWRAQGDSQYSIRAGNQQMFGFDGSGNAVLVPDAPELNFGSNQNFTVEAWIKAYPVCSKFGLQARTWLVAHPKISRFLPGRLAAWINAHWRDNDFGVAPIVAKNRTTSILEAVGFQFCLAQGHLACQLAQSPMRQLTFENFLSPGPDLQDGRWHHVAMTVNRTSPAGGNLYTDGAVVLTFDPRKQAGDLSTSEPVRIGTHSNPSLLCRFKGRIGGIALYRRALSGEEITAHFNAGRP